MIKWTILILGLFLMINAQGQQNIQSRKIDVVSYRFELEINDTTDVVRGMAAIELIRKQKSKQFFLDLVSFDGKRGMQVDLVRIDGRNAIFFQKQDKLWIEVPDLGKPGEDTLNIKVTYHGIPKDGLIISDNKFGKRSFFGDNWPNRAHHWLPVIDHPSDKATVEFLITSPDHYDVIASGELINSKPISGHRVTHHWKSTIDFPTKVMVFAASDFVITSYDTIYDIPVSSWIYEENSTGRYDYRTSVDALRFFYDTIGPCLYKKLVNVQSKTRYGGMENAGNIFYFENSVNGLEDQEDLIVHEVAHQWFGNAATEKDWHHIWLSEGFATYLTDLYWENKYGIQAFRHRLETERKAVLNYAKRTTKPVIDTSVSDWNKLLNPNSYEKGGWVLHMLRQEVGDSVFYDILQTYYDRYKFSNALTKDFVQIAEELSGRKLRSFFQQWLYTSGHPELEIQWFEDKDLLFVSVQQKQASAPFHFKLDMQLLHEGTIVEKQVLEIYEKEALFIFPAPSMTFTPVFDPEVKLLYEGKVHNRRVADKTVALIGQSAHLILQPGDLLFQDLDCGPLCDAIESVTEGYKGAKLSHIAMVLSVEGEKVNLIEAIGDRVGQIDLDSFLKRSFDAFGRPKVLVGRVRDQKKVEDALKAVKKYIGKPYDAIFDIANDAFYCSELIYYSFWDQGEDHSLFKLFPMTFKNPKTGTFDKAWVDYYKKLDINIPEAMPGLNPGGISRSPYVEILYKFGEPDNKFQLSDSR